jgi:putative acetyltransferase
LHVLIRPERPADVDQVRHVHLSAFDTPLEADLVDALRRDARPLVSLVADADDAIVGHIMFSPVTLDSDPMLMMGLAPMAVVPTRQRRGIGGALVRDGLARCRALGAAAVVVVGHADYYPRFGFSAASRFHIRSEYDVPDGAFMVVELEPGILKGRSGTVRYHAAFPQP